MQKRQYKYHQHYTGNAVMEIHSGHYLHENYVNHNLKHHYLHLPVNSSNWGKATFASAGFQQNSSNSIDDDYTVIVFLRDPIDRWLSGLSTWLTAALPQYTNLFDIRDNTVALDILFRTVRVDEHTEKQKYFLQRLNQDNMKFFMVNETLSASVVNYCATVLKQTVPVFPRMNESTLPGGKLIPKNYFRSVLESNPRYLKKVKKFFEEDYHFIKSIQFENEWNHTLSYYDI